MEPQLEGQRRRRRVAMLVIMAGAALVMAIVLFAVLRRRVPQPAEAPRATAAGPDLGGVTAPDAAMVTADGAADAGRPRATRGRRITDRELRALQRRFRGPIDHCYEKAASRVPSLVAKKTNVVVTLARGGTVGDVTVHAGGDAQLELCLQRVVRAWRFSPALEAQQVPFSLVFVR